MNTKRTIGVCLAFGIIGVVVIGSHRPIGLLQETTLQAQAGATVEVPRFEVDPAWPKIPNGWTLGQVSSAAADDKGNIWVMHRPRVVRKGLKTGPPVMVFDQAGNYIKGFGGPGTETGGYQWPSSEHGITVDYKGNVWVGGQGDDDQILKFTNDGKFIKQFGKNGQKHSNQNTEALWKSADLFVYQKTNEVFVADGYGNHRIIVFDADTGAYKRMWGAFGKQPVDDPPPAPAAAGGGRGRGGANEDTRIPAKELPASDPGNSQLRTVHGVKVSNDGQVYVADREGKRVQVFKIDGTYVGQVFVDRYCEEPHCGNGQTVASVAFSADPDQRFLYAASRSPARIWIIDRKTLKLLDSFGRPGVMPGEFYVIHHMTTDAQGNLYVSEVQDGRRVQKFVYKGLMSIPATTNAVHR